MGVADATYINDQNGGQGSDVTAVGFPFGGFHPTPMKR